MLTYLECEVPSIYVVILAKGLWLVGVDSNHLALFIQCFSMFWKSFSMLNIGEISTMALLYCSARAKVEKALKKGVAKCFEVFQIRLQTSFLTICRK